jgi:hypothetical protein
LGDPPILAVSRASMTASRISARVFAILAATVTALSPLDLHWPTVSRKADSGISMMVAKSSRVVILAIARLMFDLRHEW